MSHNDRRQAFHQRRFAEAQRQELEALTARYSRQNREEMAARELAEARARAEQQQLAVLQQIAFDQQQTAHYTRMAFNSEFAERLLQNAKRSRMP